MIAEYMYTVPFFVVFVSFSPQGNANYMPICHLAAI